MGTLYSQAFSAAAFRCAIRILLGWLPLVINMTAMAQEQPQPLHVTFSGNMCADTSFTISLGEGSATGEGQDCSDYKDSTNGSADLDPRTSHTLTISGGVCSGHVEVNPGQSCYKMLIDGVETTSIDTDSDGSWTITFELPQSAGGGPGPGEPGGGCGSCGGGASGAGGGGGGPGAPPGGGPFGGGGGSGGGGDPLAILPSDGGFYSEISLGNLPQGNQAGGLFIRKPSIGGSGLSAADIAYKGRGPESLAALEMIGSGGQQITQYYNPTQPSPEIRQILTPESLVDISFNATGNAIVIKFFEPTPGMQKTGGFYDVSGLNEFTRWTVSQPASDRVDVARTAGGQTTTSTVVEDAAAGSWSRITGGRTHTLAINETGSGASYVREEVSTVSAVPAGGGLAQVTSKEKRIYKALLIQDAPTPVYSNGLVASILDPDGMTRGTYYAYYDATAPEHERGRRQSVVYPDGSWEFYQYRARGAPGGNYSDDGGRPWKIFRPWKDQPALPSQATEQNSRVTVFTYDQSYAAGSRFNNVVKTVEERIGGVTVSKRTVDHQTSWNDGENLAIEAQNKFSAAGASIQATSKHFQHDTSSYGYTYENSAWPGKLYSSISADGSQMSCAYETGTYDAASRIFTPDSQGAAVRKSTLRGSSSSSAGEQLTSLNGVAVDPVYLFASKSTKDVAITAGSGDLVYAATEVYAGGGQFNLVTWEVNSYDGSGNLDRIDYSDGTFAQAGWTNDELQWEITRAGVRTDYLDYDEQGRLRSKIVEGAPGVVPDQNYSFDYDIASACGCEIATTTLTAGAISLIGRVEHDPAGRIKERLGRDGVLVQYAYTDPAITVDGDYNVTAISGTRQEQEVHPLWTTTTVYHRDGQVASVTGPAVTDRYYEYAVLSDGKMETTVREGSAASPRLSRTTANWRGQPVTEEAPAFDGTLATTTHIYSPSTGLRLQTSGPAAAPMLYRYDSMGNLLRQGLDLDGSGDLEPASADRYAETGSGYEQKDGQWWSMQSSRRYSEDGSAAEFEESIQRTQLTGLSASARSEQVRRIVDAAATTELLTRVDRAIDAATKTVTGTTTLPDTSQQVSVFTNSYLASGTDSAGGLSVSYSYDDAGRLEERSDSSGHYSRTTHHPGLERIIAAETSESGAVTFESFDAAGRPTAQRNALGHHTYREYDARGQLLRQWGNEVYPVEHSYDEHGQMTAMTTFRATGVAFDGPAWPSGISGDTTQWIYQNHGPLLHKKKDAADKEVIYDYNAAGRLASRQWARGVLTSYGYAASGTGDLETVGYSNDPAGTPGLTFSYDRLGRQRTVSDAMGTRTLAYARGQAAGESLASAAMPELDGLSVTTGYDALARRESLNASRGATLLASAGYAYEPASSRLETITAGAESFTYEYKPQTNLLVETITRRGSAEVMRATRSWERGRLLDRIETVLPGGGILSAHDYDNDALGRRESSGMSDGESWHYGYDSRSQVTGGEKRDAGGGAISGYTHGYQFDVIGNRTQSSRESVVRTYTPNALNQYASRSQPLRQAGLLGTASAAATVTLQSVTAEVSGTIERDGEYWRGLLDFANTTAPDAAQFADFTVEGRLGGAGYNGSDAVAEEKGDVFLAATPEDFSHDEDGNLLSDGRWTCTWNAENRLIGMETVAGAVSAGTPKQKLTFSYDAQGRRFRKEVYDWDAAVSAYQLSSRTLFVYDGWNLIAELDDSGAPARTFTWGVDLSGTLQGAGGVGGLLAILDLQSSIFHYPAYDGNGNVMALADETGSIIGHYGYGPFGEPLRVSGEYGKLNPFRFSTKYQDEETGLLYYGYRYYNPETGRWLSRDPIAERGGMNLYGMSQNNPMDYYDFLGLEKRKCRFTIAAGHGLPPDQTSEVKDFLDSVLRTGGCGDKVGAVSCFAGDLNKDYGDKGLPSPSDRFDDPNIPNYNDDGTGNPREPGLLPSFPPSIALDALEEKIKAAQDQAEKDCKDPKTCCKKISIEVTSRSDAGGPGLDFDSFAKQSQRGRDLINYRNTFDCETATWERGTL